MKHKSFALSLLILLICSSAVADITTCQRAAQGGITQPGGARRLSGDQTEAIKASLSNSTAKNVILLIGDGMGDSGITAARNYAQGAGVFFERIDALPLSAPTMRWIRKPTSQTI